MVNVSDILDRSQALEKKYAHAFLRGVLAMNVECGWASGHAHTTLACGAWAHCGGVKAYIRSWLKISLI
jgi:hypothetical protein